MLRLLLAAAVLIPHIAGAQSDRWVPLFSDTTTQGNFFVDTESLVDTPDGTSAWIRGKGGTPGDTLIDGRRFAEFREHYLVNCVTKEFDLIGGVWYDSNKRVLLAYDKPKRFYQLHSPVPETWNETRVQYICLGRQVKQYEQRHSN